MPPPPTRLDSRDLLYRLQSFKHLLTEEEKTILPCAWAFWNAEREAENRDIFLKKEALGDAEAWARNWHIRRSREGAARHTALAQQLRDELPPALSSRLESGGKAFLEAARDRLIQEHRTEFLNPCPCCGGMTRTYLARQCPHCFHAWH